ncbi:MAG TPA: Gfo/Idh/MocA family oxidoreductase, partial [Anseongella sp.]|nr:Gfo/Idh/MocA family oxidoreductase [Anseongella sp.]
MERRKFIRQGARTAAGFFIVPRYVLGGRGYTSPSDKLDIAAIGTGGKGRVNLDNSWNNGSDNIVALCDVDDRMSAEARKKWPKAKYYTDYREMFDKRHRKFDAVIVSTPDHMHAVQAMAAMELGKHLYCEKPLTHDIREARQLTEAAAKYKVVTQMGNQGSSGDSTRKIETWIQAGVIGEVKRVHVWTNRPVWPQGIPLPEGREPIPSELDWDLWLGTAPFRAYHPAYLPATWRG